MSFSDADLARLLCVGFDGLLPTGDLLQLIERGVSGVIFFSRNVESPRAFADLTAGLKRYARRPLLTCIDQEGGRVMRLREGFTPLPSMRALGRTGDPSLAAAAGSILATELRAVNIDLDFAPVLDVDTNPANPVIADRSFGPTPELVSRMGVELIRALQAGGVAGCGKHFPGHGDTSQDSHRDLPVLPHDMQRLRQIELPPFRAAIGAGVATIMTAHVIFRALDDRYPSTMSPAVLDGLLRQELGFDGVIISDDLEMKAIADHYDFDEALVRTVNAGVDLVMICHTPALQHRAIDVLRDALAAGHISPDRITQAHRRLDRLFAPYVRPPATTDLLTLLNTPENRQRLASMPLDATLPPDPTAR